MVRAYEICVLAVAVAMTFCAFASGSKVTEYLAKNALPVGLLPSSISSYTLHPDGSFQVVLDSPCYATFQNLVFYDKIISGRISYGRVDNLSGIQAEEFFVWVPVTSIHVDVPSSGYIYFSVGFVNKRLSVSLFASPPACTPGAAAENQQELPAQQSYVSFS